MDCSTDCCKDFPSALLQLLYFSFFFYLLLVDLVDSLLTCEDRGCGIQEVIDKINPAFSLTLSTSSDYSVLLPVWFYLEYDLCAFWARLWLCVSFKCLFEALVHPGFGFINLEVLHCLVTNFGGVCGFLLLLFICIVSVMYTLRYNWDKMQIRKKQISFTMAPYLLITVGFF